MSSAAASPHLAGLELVEFPTGGPEKIIDVAVEMAAAADPLPERRQSVLHAATLESGDSPPSGRTGAVAISRQKWHAVDYAVVQGVVLFTATAYITLNLFADVAYFLVNPRLRS